MAKYEPLKVFLQSQEAAEISLRFSDIEQIIGAKLPPAAHTHRAWWSNNPSNNVMTRSWLAAGYLSERVDIASERVVFRRATAGAQPPGEGPGRRVGFLDRVRERLGGTVTVAQGVDLTDPTDETWNAER